MQLNLKHSFFCTLLFLLPFVFFAQSPTIEWAKNFGGSDQDYPAEIQLTTDNKYIIAGSTNSNDFDVTQNRGGEDVWLVKLDTDGKILWQKTYGGSGNEGATAIRPTKDGGYMLLGVTNSKDGDFIASKGELDIFLSKLDSVGNIKWTKIYGGNKYDFGGSFFETETGEFVISITSRSDSLDFNINYGTEDIWIIKLSIKGEIIWKKHFGGSSYDFSGEIIQVENNNYLFVGTTGSFDKDMITHKGFLSTKGDIWIKMDTSGQVIWHKSYGFEPNIFSGIYSVKKDTSGYIGVGSCRTFGNLEDHLENEFLVARLNKNGDLIWQKQFGGLGIEYARDIEALQDGSYVILGTSDSNMSGDVSIGYGLRDYWLLRLDTSGKTIFWEKTLGGNRYDACDSRGLIVTHDNKLVVVGETNSTDKVFSKNYGIYDWGVIKLKSIGISTSIYNLNDSNNLLVYPNPAYNFVNILSNDVFSAYELTNINGQILQKGQFMDNDYNIKLNNIIKGFYILNLTKGNGTKISKKIYITDH